MIAWESSGERRYVCIGYAESFYTKYQCHELHEFHRPEFVQLVAALLFVREHHRTMV
jgi:hypothetical protein